MRKLLIAGVGLALLAGCGGGEEGGGEAATQIWPLAVGNWWAYQDIEDTTQIDTTVIVGDTVYNGHEAFLAVVQSDTVKDTTILYYADGYLWMVMEVQMDTTVDTMEMAWLKEQLEVGDQWTVFEGVDTTDFGQGPVEVRLLITAKVEGTEDKVVPAGSFPGCYIVRYDEEATIEGTPFYHFVRKVWIYYGVGSVYTADSTFDGWKDTYQLYDYELK